MENLLLVIVAGVCAAASGVFARSARHRYRFLLRVEHTHAGVGYDEEGKDAYEAAYTLAQSSYRRDAHAALLYAALMVVAALMAAVESRAATAILVLVVVPALFPLWWGRRSVAEARLTQERFEMERRAEETLSQGDLAPLAWADRLAPDDLPDFAGYEMGRVYQAGEGVMAGDFFDVFRVGPTRVAAVIGDVAGRGIESSITAFQAKYLLRVFLRQFRDPAQALEELNAQMSSIERAEEFISVVIVVFDTEAQTMRYASAGHPAAWLWHEREVQPLRATGALLMLDPNSSFFSKEIPLDTGDMVLMYTDGLAEVRYGDAQFGEDRIAMHLRRDPTVSPDVLCKSLLEAARDFADGTIGDDVAILAVRRA
ncbi:PP2C family protein-serine/threonine phosphatase [Candidatus Poriferisocius sp.]|uniref:PP2C family protein-serine/threonine phosphatase n=1 Tax=Candidatus Poriferisocius sp. TaxID=3101276 RepID=UPI003B51CF52